MLEYQLGQTCFVEGEKKRLDLELCEESGSVLTIQTVC